MATTKISIGSVGISGHLMGLLRKTTDLTAVVASVDTYPTNSGIFEFIDLEPGIYRFEVRDSPDGVALGSLIGGTYSIEVNTDQLELEIKYYTADGSGAHDPASGQPNIVDPYLDGKNIQFVFKQGDRFLIKDMEYTLIAGGGIHLEGGVLFSPGEIFEVIIANIVPVISTTANFFSGTATITSDTTLNGSYTNKKIKCASTTERLTITLPALATLVDGKFYHFTTFSGSQHNTVFNTTGGEQIEGFGTQIILGRKETLYIEKRGAQWEVLNELHGVNAVGTRFSGRYKSHVNTLPEDDTLINAADYPRIFAFYKDVLPVTHKIVTTDGAIAALVRTDDKMGCPIISETKFRMPNTQNLYERGLLSFNNYGTDTERLYDYPGGVQLPMVGPHWHTVETQNLNGDPKFQRSANHNVRSWNAIGQTDPNQNCSTDVNRLGDNTTQALENRVKGFGVVYLTRI